MTQAENIAIIPARGGSKRLPRKNILDFHGKPLLAWTIEAAQKAGIFDHIVVSTEDREIGEVALASGAEVPFFRNTAYDDYTTVEEAVAVSVEQAEKAFSKQFKNVFMLLPTCPLRGADIITSANAFYLKTGAPYVLSCHLPQGIPWWAHRLSENYVPTPLFPEQIDIRSQDLEPLYYPSGAIWIANRDRLLASRVFYGPGYLFYPIEWKAAIDIDNQQDFEFASITHQLFGQPASP
jgi:N-acylneuraminate cytidylyltransferase